MGAYEINVRVVGFEVLEDNIGEEGDELQHVLEVREVIVATVEEGCRHVY